MNIKNKQILTWGGVVVKSVQCKLSRKSHNCRKAVPESQGSKTKVMTAGCLMTVSSYTPTSDRLPMRKPTKPQYENTKKANGVSVSGISIQTHAGPGTGFWKESDPQNHKNEDDLIGRCNRVLELL